jgi:aspartate 1-decarboxylase
MHGRLSKITAATLLFLAWGALPGCSGGGNKPPKLRRIEGVAKKIDLKAGVVSMVWKNDKGAEVNLEGTVKEDAEIWINGRASRLEEVHEGDKVVVLGYRERKGEEEKLIATRIEVTRPQATDWKPVGKAATTQPAEAKRANKNTPAVSR